MSPTPARTMGMAQSALALPVRVARGLFSLARRQVTRLTDRESPSPASPTPERASWTTAPETTGPRMTEPIMPSELPIHSYDELAAGDAAHAIQQLTDPEDVALMLAYERANAKRASVIRAAMAQSNEKV